MPKNPKLARVAAVLGWALLALYLATFAWFAFTACAPGGTSIFWGSVPAAPDNEAAVYVWTTLSLFVGGVVAVAFGQPAPRTHANADVERVIICYAWSFFLVGIIATGVWIALSGRTGESASEMLIKNAAVAFFGLAVPMLTVFLRLPATVDPGDGNRDYLAGALVPHGAQRLIDLCADFTLFPDNAQLPAHFVLAGFTFDQAGVGTSWFVNDSGTERGLQFQPAGGQIVLPGSGHSTVDFRVGAFAGDFLIEGLDSAGTSVARLAISGNNTWTDQRLAGAGIAAILFTGGGGEGAIQKICVKIGCGDD